MNYVANVKLFDPNQKESDNEEEYENEYEDGEDKISKNELDKNEIVYCAILDDENDKIFVQKVIFN